MTDENREMIIFKTEPTPDGKSYMLTVDFNEDRTVALNREQAVAYALDVIAALTRAEYDAAVMNQMSSHFDDPKTPYQLIKDMRADRPELTNLGDLGLEPGVAMDARPEGGHHFRPFIALLFAGEKIGQWTADDARQHALGVLEVSTVVDLDAAYLQELTSMVGLERPVAQNVIGDLAHWR